MKRINLYEAKTHLSKLVASVEEAGEPIVLCRHGRPVADIVPHRSPGIELTPDKALKGAKFSDDPCAPVPEADWPADLR
jgi:prevent-host-death family protein